MTKCGAPSAQKILCPLMTKRGSPSSQKNIFIKLDLGTFKPRNNIIRYYF